MRCGRVVPPLGHLSSKPGKTIACVHDPTMVGFPVLGYLITDSAHKVTHYRRLDKTLSALTLPNVRG